MRSSLGSLALVIALSGLSCTSAVTGPGGVGDCIVDADCAAGSICADGKCAAALPIGGDVPPEGGEGEGASSGEGEGASGGEGEGASAGEGEGSSAGEGEGASGGEGEGEGAQSGPQTLLVSAGPELTDALPGCQCVANAPASNVDIAYTAQGGGSCQKPADQSCGVDGGRCACSALSGTSWFVSRQLTPRTASEVWIVDEAVAQTSGADGVFTVRASVVDDCLLSPASVDVSTNQACLQLDCQGSFGGAPACFDYTGLGANCGIASSNAATVSTNADCMARGTVTVRVHVEVQGTGGFTREFCTDLAQGAGVDALQLRKTNGSYTVANVSSQLREVAVGGPCS